MVFISVLIVFIVVKVWGSSSPFHYDDWFAQWQKRLSQIDFFQSQTIAYLAVLLLLPCLGVFLLADLVAEAWRWLALIVVVPVLLYSMGRGEFTQLVNVYIEARGQRNWEMANGAFYSLAEPVSAIDLEVEGDDWATLHERMLATIAYRGFERLFAAIFWFVLLGVFGALLYRLSVMAADSEQGEGGRLANKWLWLMEWPAARLLSLSFAITGNFEGCFQVWARCFWSDDYSTPQVLNMSVKSALNIEQETMNETLYSKEFEAALALFSRTWIFWMCLLAVGVIIF